MVHAILQRVTEALETRSSGRRAAYLERIRQAAQSEPRQHLGCSNLAHALAAQGAESRLIMRQGRAPHVAIISSYNDMLSAHAPLKHYPDILAQALAEQGASSQFAAGVPAMCDGITQGEGGMQLSLFSRDLIAQATAIGLSHGVFDGGLYLGVCDKIVPGLLIGALAFGHLPAVFVPAGPMASGATNREKAELRQRYARGEVSREALLEMELAAYHGQGTCTFYGTANTNQMLMEAMGLHVPGSAFVHPQSPLRQALTEQAARLLVRNARQGERPLPLGVQIDAKALINAVVVLLATGGSTNHALHLPAIARAAGYQLCWEDFASLSKIVPLVARVYPNGSADVNQFQAAGGSAWVIGELLRAGLLHEDVDTVQGHGLAAYAQEPWLEGGQLAWREVEEASAVPEILRPAKAAFAAEAGWQLVQGNLGRATIKTSAVAENYWQITAPAKVFNSEQAVQEAYQQGRLQGDFVLVVRFQGPKANGMPELHKLMPLLANLQQAGQRVALITDGRLSGASGQVLAALHVTPEACVGGALARLCDGDMLRIDAQSGCFEVLLDQAELEQRPMQKSDAVLLQGFGLELFAMQRRQVGPADEGASCLYFDDEPESAIYDH